MSETILTAENLKFRYDSEQPGYALNGVSMQVRRGEFVAVLGANGCEKWLRFAQTTAKGCKIPFSSAFWTRLSM